MSKTAPLSITGAPRVVTVVIGDGFAHRGYVTAYGAQIGKQILTFLRHTPGDPSKPFARPGSFRDGGAARLQADKLRAWS